MINSIIKSCIDFIKFVLIVKIIFMQIFQCFGICRDQSFNHIIAGDIGQTNIFKLCIIKSPDTHSAIDITFKQN